MALSRRPLPGTDPTAASAAPPTSEEDRFRPIAPPDNEIVIESRTGRIRQAGADPVGGNFVSTLRRSAEASLYVFTKSILKRKLLSPRLHGWFCGTLQRRLPYRKMRLMPRGHLKSSIVSEALPMHMHIQPTSHNLYWPELDGLDMTIILCGEKKDLMSAHLRWIETQWESNKLLRALWPHKVWDNPPKESKKWNENEMLLPRKLDAGGADPSLRVIGVDGAITGAHCRVLIKDDLISLAAANSAVIMQDAINWNIASRALLAPFESVGLEYTIGCLPADAQVLMEDGTARRLEDVKVGDRVWAADERGCLHARAVQAKIPQGVAATVTVTTAGETLRATPNHPFLVRRRRQLHWVRADALRVGDFVVTIKEVPGKLVHSWMTEEFCWLYGFLLGDGWIGGDETRGYICIALSKDEVLNARILRIAQEWFPAAPFYRTPFGYARSDNSHAVDGLWRLGFVGGAKTKCLPDWAVQLPPQHRRALLLGFCEADGHHDQKCQDMWSVEIANRGLMEQLRWLAAISGVRTGTLRCRARVIQAPHSKRPVRSEYWGSSFNFATVEREEVYATNRSWLNALRGLRQRKVLAVVNNVVAEPVYDLTVEETPAFFANGFAVHNTRWAVYDLYSHLMKTDPSVECIVRAIVEDGKLIWPEQISQKDIEQLQKEYGKLFWLLYMNTAASPDLVDFAEDALRHFVLTHMGTEQESVAFEEDGRDRLLAEAVAAPLPQDPQALRGVPLTPDLYAAVFSGRDEYLRFRAR